ncbi:serine hydrolase domain-containing protein [Hymenobacter koreensis]|uniref:Serine hydrolase domain-containing protein n=1 Tax=Hymenobacter koreensis TaxID=1084523 RepID=A0ABP8J151_9BACT
MWAQTGRAERVEAFVEKEMKQKGIPGLVFAVIKNNEVIQMKAYGYASLDHAVPVTTKTVFPLASIDKQIIATCIMMLHEQSKLSLEDPVYKYLDSIPASWKNVKIKHLLSHTSGLGDDPLENVNGRGFDRYTSENIYKYIRKQELINPVSQQFLYSDAGFFILQRIFEKASGYYYPDFINENIFVPLGMSKTRILNPVEVVEGRSVSYYKSKEGRILINNFRQISMGPHFGDIGTTIEDMVKYDVAINNNKLLKRKTYQLMWTPATVKDNRVVSSLVDERTLFNADASYGYGWELGRFRGRNVVYHSGFTGTSITKFPDDKLSVLLLTNLTYRPVFSPNAFAKQIASFYLGEETNSSSMINKPCDDSSVTSILMQLEEGKPDGSLFETHFFQKLTLALTDYKRKISYYGGVNNIECVYTVREKSGVRHTFMVDFKNGTLFYNFIFDKKGVINELSIQ